MNKKITVSAPGKLMLLGEHAVVYGKPCLVTAVDQRMKVKIELTDEPIFYLDAPDVKIENYQRKISGLTLEEMPKGAKFVEVALKNFISQYPITGGVKITTSSEFSSQFGFGSSSASTVCVIFALSQLFNRELSLKEIFDLSYKTVLDIQGKGSGFDIAAAIYGGTLHYIAGGKLIENISAPDLSLVVGYSGIKADTVTVVNRVLDLAKKYPEVIEEIYNQILFLVELAKSALEKGDFESLGELMNINQGFLSSLGVSSKKLDLMINSAKDAGSYGAKLSGAGVGDCMIAIASDKNRKSVEKAIKKAGGEIIQIKTNAQGVRIEGIGESVKVNV